MWNTEHRAKKTPTLDRGLAIQQSVGSFREQERRNDVKKLFVIRHGNAPGINLTENGKGEVRRLAEKIKAFANGGTCIIVTSLPERAQESGTIIAQALGSRERPAMNDDLECGKFPTPRLFPFIDHLGALADVAVLVSHDVSVQAIVEQYAERAGIPCDKLPKEILSASGFMVDHERGMVLPVSYL